MRGTITQILTALAAAADGEAVLDLPRVFYTEECVDAGRDAFAQYCTVAVLRAGSDGMQVRVVVHESHRKDSREVVGGLLNYLVASAARCPHGGGSGLT